VILLPTNHLVLIKFRRAFSRFINLFVPTRIRWKIVAPYVVLTLLVAFVGTYLATNLVTGSLEDRFDNQLAEAARVTSDAVVRRERQHLEVVRSISFTVGVPEDIAAGDEAALRSIVEPLAANSKAEFVEVLDPRGQRVLGLRLDDSQLLTYDEIDDPVDRTNLTTVQNIVRGRSDDLGDKFAQLVQLKEGPALYTAGPIYNGDDLAGIVLIGSSLEDLLPAIKHEALADVTFYSLDGAVLSSTFAQDGSGDADLTPPAGDVSPSSLAGLRETRSLFGRGFDLLYGELRIREETVGTFSIALPSSFISSASESTRWAMMAVFGVATAAVLGIGILIAQGVTAPLIKLARTARAVAAGDLSVRSGFRSRDEVGTLATSFDIMTDRLATQHLQTIRALTSAIDARDPYTAGHSIRVGQLSVEIGRELELAKRDLQFLEIGGYLHDVGKIGIRDNVLLKQGSLTKEERRLVEEHPRIGLKIIQHVELTDEVIQVVAGHHEKLDGSGYPYGLSAADITIFARVAAVSDIYDALTTERPYKPALTVVRAVEMIRAESEAGHLDPQVVEALIRALPRWGRRIETEKDLRGLLLPELEELAREAA
jgi:putative nucleotidyltransferase with HDIG domain